MMTVTPDSKGKDNVTTPTIMLQMGHILKVRLRVVELDVLLRLLFPMWARKAQKNIDRAKLRSSNCIYGKHVARLTATWMPVSCLSQSEPLTDPSLPVCPGACSYCPYSLVTEFKHPCDFDYLYCYTRKY